MELTNDFRVALPVERAWAVLTDVERIAPCMPGAQLQEVEGDQYRGVVKVKVGPITAQYKGQASFVELDEPGRRAVLRAEGRETRGQGSANATITATLRPEADGTAVSVLTDLTVTGKVAQFGRGVLADVSAKLLAQFVDCLESSVLVDEPTTGAPSATADGAPATTGGAGAAAVGESDGPEQAAHEVDPDAESIAAADAAPSPTDDAPAPVDAPATTPSPAPAAAPSATPGSGDVRRLDLPEPKPVDLLDAAGTPVAKRVGPVVALVALAWLLRVLVRRRRR